MNESALSDSVRSRSPLPFWGTFACVLLAYLPSFFGDFVFDDRLLLERTQAIAQPSLEGLRAIWTTDARTLTGVEGSVPYYRPVTFSSFAFDRFWGGGHPIAYHLTNLALFAVTLWLLERFLGRVLRDRRAAALVLVLFALHPARVETVGWISGRPDLLVLFGALLASEAVCWRGHLPARLAVFLFGGLVALGSKELGVVFPLFVLAGSWGDARRPRLGGRWFLGACGLVGLYLGFRALALPLPPPGELQGGPAARVGLALETLGRSASSLTVPIDLSLLGAAQRTVGGRDVFDRGFIALGLAFLTGLVGTTYRFRRHPRVLWTAGILVAALLPTANLWPMPALVITTPRFVFVPAVFFLLFVGEVVRLALPEALLRNAASRARLVTLGLAALLGASSLLRCLDFLNDESFFRSEARTASRVPMVVEALVRADLASGDLARAVVRAECGLRAVREDYPRAGSGEEILAPLLGPITTALPDGDERGLRSWSGFLRAARGPSFVRTDFPLALELPEGSRLRLALTRRKVSLAALEAEVLLRLGRAPESGALLAEFEPRIVAPADALLWARVAVRSTDLASFERLARRFPELARDPGLVGLLAGARQSVDEAARGALGPERRALLAAHRAGLAGNVVRAARRLWGEDFGFPEADAELAKIALFAADFAGATKERALLARRLSVVLPLRTAPLERERLATLRASFVDGCRFRDD